MTKTLDLTKQEIDTIKLAMRYGMNYIANKTLVISNEGKKLMTDINRVYVKLTDLEKLT